MKSTEELKTPRFFEHGKDEDEGYGLYVLTRRSLGFMAEDMGIFHVSMVF